MTSNTSSGDSSPSNPSDTTASDNQPMSVTILAAIDGSTNSYLAAGFAASLARKLKAHLGLIHVLDMPAFSFWGGVEERFKDDIRAEAERTLADISKIIGDKCELTPEFFIVEGAPDNEIKKIVASNPDIAMVVLGRRGIALEKHSHISMGRKSGGLPIQLAERLPIPVVVVPPDVPASEICPALSEFTISH